jgi:NADP-dependent 3-hydroxy acid dehydrogenase YdfG
MRREGKNTMARTILIGGYGPGVSAGVARKFGEEGWQVALVARNAERLEAGVKTLGEAGITAKAFPGDLGDPQVAKKVVGQVREALGPITAIHWNAYAALAGDLTTCDLDDLRTVFDVGVVGAVATVQAALPDLREQAGAAVLITGGGFALYVDQADQMAVQWNAMGLAVVKSAQHKLTGLLHHKLEPDGIYVGSLVVVGAVMGTALSPDKGLEPSAVADAFWQLYQDRKDVSRHFPG